MIRFSAQYFDGLTSAVHEAEVEATDEGLLVLHTADTVQSFPLHECSIAPPLGRTPRSIELPGGAKLITNDNDAVTALETRLRQNRGLRLVRHLEEKWAYVLGCLAAMVFVVWLFIEFGIPVAASWIAFRAPQTLRENMSAQVLQTLDKVYFSPSTLELSRRTQLHEKFTDMAEEITQKPDKLYALEFRSAKKMGANALALPSGIIILTDELVHLAENDQEILAVLAHEIGHVENQHGLRMVIEKAGVVFIISVLLGDITSTSTLAGVLPTVLVQSRYSRKFETEADTFAAQYLIHKGLGTAPLQQMLLKLSGAHSDPSSELLSTHPQTQKRIQHLQSFEMQTEPGRVPKNSDDRRP